MKGRPRTKTYDNVMRFIVHYKCQHDGNSPTMREVMSALNMSQGGLVYALKVLEKDGKILPAHGKSREIQVVGGQWIPPHKYVEQLHGSN